MSAESERSRCAVSVIRPTSPVGVAALGQRGRLPFAASVVGARSPLRDASFFSGRRSRGTTRAPAWPACRPSARPAARRSSTLLDAGDLRARADRGRGRRRRPARRAPRNPRASSSRRCPTCATMMQWRPITTLWAIWTRLSILVPSPITVSRVGAAVDRRVGADLDVVLDDDAADLRHLEVPPRPDGEAEPVLADAHAGMDDDAVAEQRVQHASRWARSSSRGRSDTCGPITAPAPIDGARADLGAGPDDRAGIDRRRPPRAAPSGWTKRAGRDAVAAEDGAGPQRRRDRGGPATVGVGAIGLAARPARSCRPAPWRRSAARRGRRRPASRPAPPT